MPGSIQEQLDGRRCTQVGEQRTSFRPTGGKPQRFDPLNEFAPDAQRFATRRENVYVRASF